MKNQQQTLPDLLLVLRRKINECIKPGKLKEDLTTSQIEVLKFLHHAEGQTSMEMIAKHLHIRPPSVTTIIDKMEKLKLILREKDPNDRRITNIALTKEIQKKITAIGKQKEKFFVQMMTKLSAKDKAELERILLVLTEK